MLLPALFILQLAIPSHAARKPLIQSRTELQVDAPWSMVIAKGSKLDIKGVAGSISVTRAPVGATTVTIERDAGAAVPRIELVTHDQGYTLCAIYPSQNPKKPNECVPGGGGRMYQGFKKGQPAVRFRVSVPEGVDILGRLFDGDISVDAGATNLDLEVITGRISIAASSAQYVQATVGLTGDVEASLIASPAKRSVSLSITNGTLRATIPKGRVFYNIQSRYRIDTPFELEAGAIPENWMGELGDGGETLHLDLSSGYLGRIVLRGQ